MFEMLTALRHNLSQALLAELYGCSQPTVSRLVGRLTPIINAALTPNTEQTAAHELRSTVRVDGLLAPTGDQRKDTYTSGMYSSKRHACGSNIQVVGSHRLSYMDRTGGYSIWARLQHHPASSRATATTLTVVARLPRVSRVAQR